MIDPSTQIRDYSDIEKIIRGNQIPLKTSETRDSSGHFKSYSVKTG